MFARAFFVIVSVISTVSFAGDGGLAVKFVSLKGPACAAEAATSKMDQLFVDREGDQATLRFYRLHSMTRAHQYETDALTPADLATTGTASFATKYIDYDLGKYVSSKCILTVEFEKE